MKQTIKSINKKTVYTMVVSAFFYSFIVTVVLMKRVSLMPKTICDGLVTFSPQHCSFTMPTSIVVASAPTTFALYPVRRAMNLKIFYYWESSFLLPVPGTNHKKKGSLPKTRRNPLPTLGDLIMY